MQIRLSAKLANRIASISLLIAVAAAAISQERVVPDVKANNSPPTQRKWALVIHGGAGVIERKAMTPEADASYRAGMKQAAEAAEAVLDRGGSAMDAVEAAIRLLEDNPLFNAGKGAVFTYDGKVELDAAIMDGSNMKAGAVAGVRTVRHPISLARAVMERSPHVMLAGAGADTFAATQGLEIVPQSYFFTERRWQSLIKQLQKEHAPIPPRPEGAPPLRRGLLPSLNRRRPTSTGRWAWLPSIATVTLRRAPQLAARRRSAGIASATRRSSAPEHMRPTSPAASARRVTASTSSA